MKCSGSGSDDDISGQRPELHGDHQNTVVFHNPWDEA